MIYDIGPCVRAFTARQVKITIARTLQSVCRFRIKLLFRGRILGEEEIPFHEEVLRGLLLSVFSLTNNSFIMELTNLHYEH